MSVADADHSWVVFCYQDAGPRGQELISSVMRHSAGLTTTLVSLTAFRKLDFEFFVDADITELDLHDAPHEWQHQRSEEITISHRQPRLTWVGAVFFLNEFELAVSAFVMDFTNLQVQTPIGIGVFDIRNAAAATIRGVEVEHTSRIGEWYRSWGACDLA